MFRVAFTILLFSPICRNLNYPNQNLENCYFIISGKWQPRLNHTLFSSYTFTQATVTAWEIRTLIFRRSGTHLGDFFIFVFGIVHCCALQKCISHSTTFRQQHQFNKFLFLLTGGWEENFGLSNLTLKFLIHGKVLLHSAPQQSYGGQHPFLTRMDLIQPLRVTHQFKLVQ